MSQVNDQLADLWREWLDGGGDPSYAGEIGGDTLCIFCSALLDLEEHDPDCVYARAKALIEQGQGKETDASA